jgi:hypothetical protein
MSEDLDQTAASYVLGIARGAARAAIEARLAGAQDLQTQALQTKVKLWQENFAALDLAAMPERPPEGVFDTILAAINAGAKEIPGALTRRAGTGVWSEMSPGVTYHPSPNGARCWCAPCPGQHMSRTFMMRASRNVSSSKAISSSVI